GVKDTVLAKPLFTILVGFVIRLSGTHGDMPAVWRPLELVDSLLEASQLLGLAAIGGHHIYLRRAFRGLRQHGATIGDESDPAPIWRPGGREIFQLTHHRQP